MFEKDESMLQFGVTSVDNVFIRDYLPAAKGDYVKVYLYGLSLCMRPDAEMSLSSLAHELNMSESDVESALRYWERRRLVLRLSDAEPRYRFRSALQLMLSGEAGIEADPEYVDFTEDVYALFGDRRKIRPAEISLAWEWVQDLKLRPETVLMLLSHCMTTRGLHFSFQVAQAEAVRMAENNVVSAEDAESYFAHSRRVQEGAKAVLRRMGKRRNPSQDEMDLYTVWTKEWHYDHEAILEACSETTKGEPTFAYLNGILKGLRERAERKNAAPRTQAALREQLSSEKTENAAVREFAKALGKPTAAALIAPVYQRLAAEHPADFLLLVAQETHKAGGDLDAAIKMCEQLKRRGIATHDVAKAYFEEMHRLNRALQPVFEAAGMSGRPAASDRTLLKKWQGWGFSEEMLIKAAELSANAERKIPYMDKILEAWHNEGVTTLSQVAQRKPRPAPTAGVKQVTAQQYTQREYTDEELNAFTADLIEEARKLNEQ